MQSLEPAGDRTRTQYLPHQHRRGDALHLDGTEFAVLEDIADQPTRACSDDYSTRLGYCLKPRAEVRRLADHRLFLRRSFANQISDNDQSGGDSDPRLKLNRPDVETTASVNSANTRSD